MRYGNERKVAIALLAAGEERAAAVLKALPKDLARRVLSALANLDAVSDTEAEAVCREVAGVIRDAQAVERGPAAADVNKILAAAARALGDATLATEFARGARAADLQEALSELSAETLARHLAFDRPQVVAALLALARPEQAANVLRRMPEAARAQVVLTLAKTESIDAETLSIVHEHIASLQKAGTHRSHARGGTDTLIAAVRAMNADDREALLAGLAARDAGLAETIREALVTVERLCSIDPRDLAKVVAKVADADLATLVRNLGAGERAALLGALSTRRREEIDDRAVSERVPKDALDGARARFVAAADALHAEGAIAYPWDNALV